MHPPSVRSMTRTLFRLAAFWTAVGLVMGLYYRTLTHSRDFTGQTQLSVTHTHSLALGMLMLLVLTGLSIVLPLHSNGFRWGVWTYNLGLALTVGTMAVRGTMQVLGTGAPHHPALNGVSGLGHMALTAALVMILGALGGGIKERESSIQPVE